MGGQVGAIRIRKFSTEELSCPPRNISVVTQPLKFRMNWLNILLYIPHCRYGVPRRLAESTARVISKSLPRSLVYDTCFYLCHCDMSLFLKAKAPHWSYA